MGENWSFAGATSSHFHRCGCRSTLSRCTFPFPHGQPRQQQAGIASAAASRHLVFALGAPSAPKRPCLRRRLCAAGADRDRHRAGRGAGSPTPALHSLASSAFARLRVARGHSLRRRARRWSRWRCSRSMPFCARCWTRRRTTAQSPSATRSPPSATVASSPRPLPRQSLSLLSLPPCLPAYLPLLPLRLSTALRLSHPLARSFSVTRSHSPRPLLCIQLRPGSRVMGMLVGLDAQHRSASSASLSRGDVLRYTPAVITARVVTAASSLWSVNAGLARARSPS